MMFEFVCRLVPRPFDTPGILPILVDHAFSLVFTAAHACGPLSVIPERPNAGMPDALATLTQKYVWSPQIPPSLRISWRVYSAYGLRSSSALSMRYSMSWNALPMFLRWVLRYSLRAHSSSLVDTGEQTTNVRSLADALCMSPLRRPRSFLSRYQWYRKSPSMVDVSVVGFLYGMS